MKERGDHMLYMPREEGQGLVEYALIIALIAILLIFALGWITSALNTVFARTYWILVGTPTPEPPPPPL